VTIPGNHQEDDYLYFGEAKNLPEVRKLFEKEAPTAPKKTREELHSRVTYEYLGLADDSALAAIEAEY